MIRDRVAETLELFMSGQHCSQSVLAVFCDDFGLPVETALKIAAPFGGGLGGCGKTCGALTGALMVIGLRYGSPEPVNHESRDLTKQKSRELIALFEQVHGSCNCNDLVGFDRSNLTGAELLARLPYFHNTCPKFLETVIAYLEEEI